GGMIPEPPSTPGLALALLGLAALLAAQGLGNGWRTRPLETGGSPLALANADGAELQQLPGLSVQRTRAILQARQQGLKLEQVEDLEQVPGLGPHSREQLRPYFPETRSTGASEAIMPPSPAATSAAGQAASPLRVGGIRKIQPGEPPIHLNRASSGELQRLPSIGPVLAQRIIAARSERPFQRVEDLLRVPGIGPKTLEKLRPFVTLD
ncbi:MAG: helix-hairpin-helix domain-containing protein, partial [Gemmataceae bacterium]|nr:helix-hairpin-helix domain-containing protein [Gemmataceae bacterium]